MQRISDAGMEWLDYTAKALPRYRMPDAETLSELLSKLCDCEISLTVEDLNLDSRVECLTSDGPALADAMIRLADHIETWEKGQRGAWVCPDLEKFGQRIERMDSEAGLAWLNVCSVTLDEHEYAEGGDTPVTSLGRLEQILKAGGQLPELRADLQPVIGSDAYEAVEAARRVCDELSLVLAAEPCQVRPRTIQALRSVAADLRVCIAGVAMAQVGSMTQSQIAKGADVTPPTVRSIAQAAGIEERTGGIPYTAAEVVRIRDTARTGGTRKGGWTRVAKFLRQVGNS